MTDPPPPPPPCPEDRDRSFEEERAAQLGPKDADEPPADAEELARRHQQAREEYERRRSDQRE